MNLSRNWDSVALEQAETSFYKPSESVELRSDAEVEEFRRCHDITIVKGADKVPKPTLTFEEAGFSPEIMMALDKEDFESPMPIQVRKLRHIQQCKAKTKRLCDRLKAGRSQWPP